MTKARTLADNYAADISGITAGTGITGGGTSGTVTITNEMATTIDAKGDLVVGTGADTFGRLAVASTAGYLLTVDSGETTGLKWAAPAGGITSASSTVATEQSTTSTSFTDLATTGPSVTLTTGTKALVIVSAFMYANANNVYSSMSYAVSGATTISAGGGALQFRQSSDNIEQAIQMSRASVVTLTAGSNTFTAKYATGSNTSTFDKREIFVIDLGS